MELIKANIQTMSSREIAELTGKRHSDVMRDIRTMYEQLGQSISASAYNDAQGKERRHYTLDQEMTITLVSGYNVVMRNKIINRWRELESKQSTPEMQMAQGLIAAQQVIEAAQKQIAEMKPKAEFYDDVTGSADTISMAEVAKVLNIKGLGRNKLFELLRDKSILQRDNTPYQNYVDRGYFRLIESKYTKPDGSTHINLKTVVYQKGLDFIRKSVEAV